MYRLGAKPVSASWIVSVDGREYGPYTDAQMAAFATEGRIAPQSLIARPGQQTFKPASEAHPALFALSSAEAGEPSVRPAALFARVKEAAQISGESAHIVIIADMKSQSTARLEEEIFRLGPACPILPQTWLLQTDKSVNTVRNQLVQQLGERDVLFVVDATNDKAAWFNFEAEAEGRIHRTWTRHEVRLRAAS
jgi:hypothetical protein